MSTYLYYRGRSKLLITRVSKIEILKSGLDRVRVWVVPISEKIEIKKEEQEVRKERRSENPSQLSHSYQKHYKHRNHANIR